jgi:hypothetical protein
VAAALKTSLMVLYIRTYVPPGIPLRGGYCAHGLRVCIILPCNVIALHCLACIALAFALAFLD